MELEEKVGILAAAAKYDASCSSSGGTRSNSSGGLGNSYTPGICHSWSGDGRCISLLKILLTNYCIYNCAYCVNRSSNDIPRAGFNVAEIVDLTLNFYRRNYIEGLFLSSGIVKNPDFTMELLVEVARRLRRDNRFNGYIHLKAIPGASPELLSKAGKWADRLSVNIELPTEQSLRLLAPDKTSHAILYRHPHRSEPRRTAKIDQSSALCPGRAEHPIDHRRHSRDGSADHPAGGGFIQ